MKRSYTAAIVMNYQAVKDSNEKVRFVRACVAADSLQLFAKIVG